LGDTATRYGDVPPRPDPAIRPSVRFPRAADEPVPDVVARPIPDEADSEEDPATRDHEDRLGSTEPGSEDEIEIITAIDLSVEEGDDDGVAAKQGGGADTGEDAWTEPAASEQAAELASPALPHWSEPPTGEMPQLLPEADPVDLTGEESLDAYAAAASTAGGPRFLTGVGDWAQEDLESMDALGDDSTNVGALESAPEDDDTAFDREVGPPQDQAPGRRGRVGAPRGRTARASAAPEDDLPPRDEADLTTRIITGRRHGGAGADLSQARPGRHHVLATRSSGCATRALPGPAAPGFRPATILAVLGLPRSCRSPTNGASSFPFTIAIVTVVHAALVHVPGRAGPGRS
jgi:hypothetical protein